MKKFYVYTDGGSRNNPGPAGIGFVIYNEHREIIQQYGKYIGEATNNVAEYSALLAAVKWLYENKQHAPDISGIVFHSDSELMVKQMLGSYKIKDTKLKSLAIEVRRWLDELNISYCFEIIPREKNTYADKLVNDALDKALA